MPLCGHNREYSMECVIVFCSLLLWHSQMRQDWSVKKAIWIHPRKEENQNFILLFLYYSLSQSRREVAVYHSHPDLQVYSILNYKDFIDLIIISGTWSIPQSKINGLAIYHNISYVVVKSTCGDGHIKSLHTNTSSHLHSLLTLMACTLQGRRL